MVQQSGRCLLHNDVANTNGMHINGEHLKDIDGFIAPSFPCGNPGFHKPEEFRCVNPQSFGEHVQFPSFW